MIYKKTMLVILCLTSVTTAGCSSERTVTQDYLNGFRIGQLASVSGSYTLGLISGENACKALKNGLTAVEATKKLVKPDSFEGCVAGYDAGITGKTPKLGDSIK